MEWPQKIAQIAKKMKSLRIRSSSEVTCRVDAHRDDFPPQSVLSVGFVPFAVKIRIWNRQGDGLPIRWSLTQWQRRGYLRECWDHPSA